MPTIIQNFNFNMWLQNLADKIWRLIKLFYPSLRPILKKFKEQGTPVWATKLPTKKL